MARRINRWTLLVAACFTLVPLMSVPAASADSAGSATAATDADAPVDSEAGGTDRADAGEASASADSQDAEEEAPPSPAPTAVSSHLSKLQVHGFLTQAYATGSFQKGRFPALDGSPSGPTAEEVSLGIPEDGTSDYRNLAIQFRYEISPKDIMVIQLSSRALGDSPINAIEDEIELDWAFYERRITDATSIKVGRVQIPYGLFNEIRDVGTILPFYRPSFNFYREGSFTSETVDGFALSHQFLVERPWNFEVDVYWGEWDAFELDPFSNEALPVRNEDSWGGQLWLNTPITGLRYGIGFQERNTVGGAEGVVREPGTATRFTDWLTSLEIALDRFVGRAEYFHRRNRAQPFPVLFSPDFRGIFESYYIQVGYHFNSWFRVYLQSEVTDVRTESIVFSAAPDYTQREDNGIALNFVFSPNLVFKAEYHEVSGEDQSFFPLFTPAGLLLQPIYSDLEDGDYTILSLSASF